MTWDELTEDQKLAAAAIPHWRERLPNRRTADAIEVEHVWRGAHGDVTEIMRVTVGRHPDGRIGEVFIDYPSREAFERALTRTLEAARIELICLAGFMRLLTAGFVDHWRDRMINIHPSLLPAFPGLDTHARALAEGVRFAGCTVHFVRTEMDHGPIIVQAAVPVLQGDDEHALAARVLAAEHRAYPLALKLIAEGRVKVVGERTEIAGMSGGASILLNPPDDQRA